MLDGKTLCKTVDLPVTWHCQISCPCPESSLTFSVFSIRKAVSPEYQTHVLPSPTIFLLLVHVHLHSLFMHTVSFCSLIENKDSTLEISRDFLLFPLFFSFSSMPLHFSHVSSLSFFLLPCDLPKSLNSE